MSERVKKYRAKKRKLEEIQNLRKQHIMEEVTTNKVKGSRQTTNGLGINHTELYCDENTSDYSDNNENCNDNFDSEPDENCHDNFDSESDENCDDNFDFEPDEDCHVNFNSQPDTIVQLREWIIACRIPHLHSDKLLKILRHRLLPTLPICTKTFLQSTSAKYLVENMEDSDNSVGEFTYLGIAQGLTNCVNVDLHTNHELHLQFNIDGMKPYKSSNRTLWPILCKIYFEPNIYEPFTVALYSGTHKPKSLEQYLNKFINEINELLCEGLIIGETQVSIKIKSFICDTPARSYLKYVKGYMSFDGCERCHVKGEKHENTTVFLNIYCDKRTDEEFRTFSDCNHHNGVSPLIFIEPNINMISQFVLDPMHLFDEGVMKRLLHFWMCQKNTKLNIVAKTELDRRIGLIRKFIPHEFQRKIRSTNCFDKYKASEYRFFLLYCGPVVLKNILDDFKYNHFLLLHVAYRLLHAEVNNAFTEYAREYLNTFVSVAKDLYGKQFVTINVHNLCHTVDDVENMNCPINLINAYNFESHLGQIKNVLRSPYRTVSQFCRREYEKILHIKKVVTLPKEQEIISERPKQGILEVKYKQYLLTSKCPNNMVLLNNGTVMEINFIFLQEEDIYCNMMKYDKINMLYNYPCNSDQLFTFEVKQNIKSESVNIHLNQIKCKLVKMKLNFKADGNEKLFVMPLL